ncbi:hypothetical protein ACTVJH_09905 [Desulfoplanes sp. PS50]
MGFVPEHKDAAVVCVHVLDDTKRLAREQATRQEKERAQCTVLSAQEKQEKERAQCTVLSAQEKQEKESAQCTVLSAQEKLKDVRGFFRAWQTKELETDLSISDNFSNLLNLLNFSNFLNFIISSYI